MSVRQRRPKGSADLGLGGIFKGIGTLFDLASQMAEEGREEYSHTGEEDVFGGKGKAVYGFSVRLGLGGKPIIEQFGNIKATEKGPVVAEVREPLADILDEGDEIAVIVELPGVDAEGIHIEVKGDILELNAEGTDRKYSKEFLLPSLVEPETMKSSYRNGILEIRLRKKR